ncbi:hypothetical protein [Deinococcus multiflagellatus]|uniref:Uncharacterized protein n=1 Tax=Deinococcus multiflagellatus TaxID=1656887 RepID=A0ABW1ZH90_9DEIO|nr:hypothetical protein [Deinococcus multiflagellatus]MBZ9714250.1 hypothetical protein [Deinococcus multiflagellatus]
MNKINVILAALALCSTTPVLAAATAATQSTTVTATNSGTDTLSVTGNLSVDFVNAEFGTTAQAAGSASVAYETQDNTADGDRSITVSLALAGGLTSLPAGMTISLTPTVGTAAAGNGGTGAAVNFSGNNFAAQNLITGIAQFTTGGTANVAYSVTATRGFENFTGTLTYTIGTGL